MSGMSGMSEQDHAQFSSGHPYNYRQDSYSVASYGSPEQGTFPHPQDLRDFRYASMSRMPGSNMDR